MNNKKAKRYLILLYIGSFIVSLAPLVFIMAWNWGDYTKTPGDTVKLCFGGVLILIFVFLKVIGKLKMPRRIVLFGIVFILSYLFQAILKDLIIISGMALLGEFLDCVLFQRPIKVLKEKIVIEKTADSTASKVEEVMKKYFEGNGRV